MKKLLIFLRDLKIKYKLLIIFTILIYILVNSWLFSYTTSKDVEDSYKKMETYTFPYLITTNILKDNLHSALLAVYDYEVSGNFDSKELYALKMQKAMEAAVYLFQISETQTDLEFTSSFIEEQTIKIKTTADAIIELYEKNPDDPKLDTQLQKLSNLRNDFTIFLDEKVNVESQNQIKTASDFIQKRTELIRIYLIIVISTVVVIIILLIIFISHNISKPLNILTKASEDFGKGKLVKVDIEREDEIGVLAETFNKMTDNISTTQNALKIELSKTKEIDRQKSEFLSIAAHQLRTPMSGLKWMLSMLLEEDFGKLTAEQKHYLENGMSNSERMIKLINSLLDIAKIEEQKFQYKFKKQSIINIINDAIFSLNNSAQQKSIKIKFQKDDDIPDLNIDEEKMEVALHNIIENSIKYSPNAKNIDISVKKQDNLVIISITDYGYGIPKNQINQVFSKFFRGSNILKIETEYNTIGTGLGLYITKDIINKHDGELTFTTCENTGTTFVIKLKL